MQVEVIALVKQRYNGKWREPGEEFFVSPQDANTLQFIRRVKRKNMTAEQPTAPRAKRPYKRRDLTSAQLKNK